jgi:VanZ family protein
LSTSRPNLLRAWWPAAVWMILIAIESTDYFSAQNTGGMLYALATRLFGPIDLTKFLVFHHYLRKSGHVLGYGILCLLLLRGLRTSFHQFGMWVWRTALYAWMATACIASMDEWHQSFIPSRMGSPRDVLLDSTAGLIFLLFAYVRLRRSNPVEQVA